MLSWRRCGIVLLLAAWPCVAQLPDTGVVLWLKADAGVKRDAEARVSEWADQSGNGNHFAQAAPGLQPTFVEDVAGGRAAIRFDGIDDALTVSTSPIPVAGRTVFAVVKWNAARTYSFALGCGEGTDGYLRLHGPRDLLTGGRYPLLYQNGILSPKVGYAAGDGRQIFHKGLHSLLHWNVYAIPETAEAKERLKHLGKNELNNVPDNRFIGEIAEVIVLDGILGAAEREQVEQYLGGKYLGWPAARAVPVRNQAPGPAMAAPTPVAFTDDRLCFLAHGTTERPLAPGRYRVHFDMMSSTREQDRFTVRLGHEVRPLPVAAGERPWTEHSMDFVIPVGQAAEAAMVRVSWEGTVAEDGGEPSRAAVRNLWVEPLAPIVISDVQVDKILYAPGQEATASIVLRNFAAEAQDVQVGYHEVTGLDDWRTQAGGIPVTVPGGGELRMSVTYNVGRVEYGRELRVEVWREDRRLDVRRELYSVADNLWKVAVGSAGGGNIPGTAAYSHETIAKFLRQARAGYANWFEKIFWAPDDWGQLVAEPGATWFSGQTRRHENTEKLQFQIRTAHELGMKAITYGKCMAGGPPGWEMARRRPQWFSVDAYGRTMGRPGDVWDLDHWHEADQYKPADFKYVWTYRWVDLRRLDALDHGIDQLIASTRLFGWDGVRYDSGGFRAHFVPRDGKVLYDGVDSFNTRNMRRTKERLWREFPGYLFGFNTNDPVGQAATQASAPRTPADPVGHEFREMMAGGGLWMFEGMRDRPDFWGRRIYKTWSDYATDMVEAIRTIKGYGGHACFSYGQPTLYKFMIGTMIGAHDYVGEHSHAPGSEHWGAFLTRWSGFIWDHRLRALPDPERTVTVTAKRPLWWKEFANELVVSPSRRYVIIHLMNPPVNDECAKTGDEVPVPLEEIAFSFRHPGERFVRARFIAPDTPNRNEALVPRRDGEAVHDWLPRVDIWAMVVLEFRGTYRPPADPPVFTEPLSEAELAEMEQCRHLFNVPVADNLADPTPHSDPEKALPKDFGAATVVPPAGYAVGGEAGTDVLVVKGFYHYTWRLPEALRAAGARVTECTARDLPKDYPDLARYDIVVLVNMGAESWDADGHRRLADFARAGGRLIVLGGGFTLGQGFFKGTQLEAVLPVEVRVARDVYQAPEPLALGEREATPFDGRPLLYFFHAARPRPDAKPLLWAGELPIAWERAVDKGITRVFLATTLGEAARGQTPFWEWDGWAPLAVRLVLE